MSGDMLNNPDTMPASYPQDSNEPSQTSSAPSPSSEDQAIQACWGRVNLRMRKDIGDAAWRHWIKPLRVSRLEDGTLTLEAESTLARERVSSQYADRLRVISAAEFNDVSPSIRHVEVRLASNRARSGQPHRLSEQKQAPAAASNSAITASATEGRDNLMAGLDPRYTFANFVVGI